MVGAGAATERERVMALGPVSAADQARWHGLDEHGGHQGSAAWIGTWALCWPNSEWGRFGELPCPNMTLNPADGKWDKSPLFYSGWKFHACDEACKKRINAEAANDWMPGPSCGDNQSYSNPLPGCGGSGDSATDYYRAPIGSYADMMLYYQKKMMQTFADGVYCALSKDLCTSSGAATC